MNETRAKSELSPLKAIRRYYLGLHAGKPSWVRDCPMVNNPLYVYRFGRKPSSKR